jgi:hypothetical protein
MIVRPRFLYAPEGEEGAAPPKGEEKPPEGAPPAKPEEGAPPETGQLTLTQAQFDARMKKAREAWEKEAKEAADKANLTEVERLKAEKQEAEGKVTQAQQAANQRLIKAEAKIQAQALGVKADRLAMFLKNVDLDDIDVDDNGEPDEKAIKAAVEATLALLPEFKGSTAPPAGSSGGEHNGAAGKVWTKAEVAALSVEDFEKHEAEIMAQTRSGTLA